MTVDSSTKPLETLVQALPPELRLEVRHFVEFLLSRYESKPKQKLRQDWANALPAPDYSSVELQHLALTWRSE